MIAYLNTEKQKRFNQLISLFASGEVSDEQEAELLALRKEMQQNKKERADKLSSIKAHVSEFEFSVSDIFSMDEIAAAAGKSGVASSQNIKTGKKNTKKVRKGSRPSDSNEVLLVLHNEPGEKGPSEWCYRQGRVFEQASGTTSQPWAMRAKQFPSKLLKIGYSAAALRQSFTPSGAAYFATEPGQAELVKLVDVTLAARKVLKVA